MADRRIALATCAEFPDLDDDDRLLLPALGERGIVGVPTVWDDPSVRWGSFDAVVIRETWDYAERHADFEAWLEEVEPQTTVLNPPRLVRWNLDKGYLGVLASGGVPTVPTRFVQPGGYLRLPTEGQFVVKPTISAGSRETARYDARTHGMQAVGHAQRLLESGRTVMIQPYVDSVDERGETAMVIVGGTFSHAVRKGPLLELGAAPTTGLFAPETIEPLIPSEAERDVADAVLAAMPTSLGEPLYARVDLLHTDRGPVLLDLELTEPSLFLAHGGAAPARLADALLARLDAEG